MLKTKVWMVIVFTISTIQSIYAQEKSQKPNLIVIMADDLGYKDVGFHGCEDIPTPNIDRIANDGVKFTNAYTSYAVCGPSRAGFITGRYQQRFGFERNPQYRPKEPKMGLPQEEKTIAEALDQVGYYSGVVGKWHLGAHKSNFPTNRGFDEFFGHLGGGHFYFPNQLTLIDDSELEKDDEEEESYRTWITHNEKPVKTEKYLTDEFSDYAVDFVSRNQDKPFFLYLSYNAPHTPLQAKKEDIAKFDHITDEKRKIYAAMVSCLDQGVGRLLDKLEELDLDDNTIIFFLSDNGGPAKSHSDNTPLRGRKGSPFEGGFRVPFAMRWPAQLKANQTYDAPVSSLDILATIGAINDVPVDSSKPLDGVNLVPYIKGEAKGIPHDMIYLRMYDAGHWVVREGDYKYMYNKSGWTQLYNLSEDLGETNNIAKQNPEIVKKMDKIRLKWDAELMDPTFLGLVHTKKWVEKLKKKKSK